MEAKYLVCLVVLIAVVSAVPLNRDNVETETMIRRQCARQCKDNPTKFNYQRAHTYVYEYRAEAETNVAGASEDKAKMYIETLANIRVISQCEFSLRLQNVQVYHSEPNSESLKPAERQLEFQKYLTENSLRFSFDDGVIRDICHTTEEKIWVLNFKRGLLSAFQNSMKDLENSQTVKEIDVTGECEAKYSKTSGWLWHNSIKKSKDLLACYKRSGLRTLIPMVPYRIQSDIQSLPIVKSSHECEHKMSSSKVLESTVCEESHVFAPFSNQQSGGSTKIKQTLTLKSKQQSVESRPGMHHERRSNLLFQHINGIDEIQNGKQAAVHKLKEICDQTKNDIRRETPRLFTELAQIVKDLERSDLKDLYRMIKNERICRRNDKAMKFFLDTLPIAGTTAAVKMMAEVINNDEIPDMEKQVWLTSLSLIPEPQEEMLPPLQKLLSGNFANQALLPVSALLNTMCRKNVKCEQSEKFKDVVRQIKRNIDSSCNADDRSQIMETLRAIGNIGYGQPFLRTLKNCLSSRYSALEVKVAAADAYRRFECQNDEHNGVLSEVFQAQNAESELRIMAFLSLMRCPTNPVLDMIIDQMQREKDNDVQTFVKSHLKNIMETSDPHKQDLAELLRQKLKPLNSFMERPDKSGIKTSRCFESSKLLKKLNVGYVADGDLIWSQKSAVPRAMKLNLTVEMFGNSINLFEAGVRMEGLDNFIQKYFGTEGYFTSDKASPEDLEGFLYARMFGNELYFKQLKGQHVYEKVKSHLDFDKLMQNLQQDYDFKYTHSQQLMDDSFIIPSAIGLPVNLTINSTLTVNTEAKGKIDFGGILSLSKPIEVTSNVIASAGLEVTGSMTVDALLYKQGVRMRNTLHTSGNFKAKMLIKKKETVNFEIESPQEKQEIFDARSQFFIVHNNFEEEQEMIKENRKELEYCTGDKFAKVTGIELCGVMQYPNASMKEDAPYFPMTGPARFSLIMNKKDSQQNYKIFAKWVKNSKKIEAQLQFDTPGSQVDRRISADVTVGMKKMPHVDVVFISPWKKLVLNGKAAKNNDISALTGSIVVDDKKQYKLTSELKKTKKQNQIQYVPLVEVENNKQRITLLTGTVSQIKNKETDISLDIQDFQQQTYSVKSKLINHSQERRLELSVGRKGERHYKIKIGSVLHQNGKKNQNIKIDPELMIQTPKGVIVSFQSNAEFQNKPLKVRGNIELDTIRMRKPITLKVDVTKKGQSYPVSAKFSSPILSGDLKGRFDTKKKNSQSGKMVLNYRSTHASIKDDTITWDGKVLSKIRKIYSQYKVVSVLSFRNMPEYNTVSNLMFTHKQDNTNRLKLKVHNGNREKSDNKIVDVFLNVKSIAEADIKAFVETKRKDKTDVKVLLDHSHNQKKVKTIVRLKLPISKQAIKADLLIQDKSKSLYQITAEGTFHAGDKHHYNLKSDLIQQSQKLFNHVLIVSENGEQHVIRTNYKNDNEHHHDIVADIQSPQLSKPLKVDVSAAIKHPSDFHIRGTINEAEKTKYSIDASSKLENEVAGKWNLEISHPERRIKAEADFDNVNNRINTNALLNWDVDSDEKPKPQIHLKGQFARIPEADSLLMKSNIKISTPFESFENIVSNINFEHSDSEIKSKGKIILGRKDRQILSDLSVKLPLSIESAKLDFQAKTPFQHHKNIRVKIDHQLDSKMKTAVKAKLGEECQVILNGNGEVNDHSTDINGDLLVETPYQPLRHIFLRTKHIYNEQEIKSFLKMKKNNEVTTEASFHHKIQNRKKMIYTHFSVDQKNKEKQVGVAVKGHYLDINHHSLDIDVKTPLEFVRDVKLQIGNEIEKEEMKSRFIFQKNNAKTGYAIKLKNKEKELTSNVLLLLSPVYNDDIHWISKFQHDAHPITITSQLSWKPTSVINIVGSYKGHSMDDMELNLKLTTPFKDYKNINLVASHMLKNSMRTTHISLDYALRKLLVIEMKSRNTEMNKLIQVKAEAPGVKVQHFNAMLKINTHKRLHAQAKVELELTPEEKYKGSLFLKSDDSHNVKGEIEIETPIEVFRHIKGSFDNENGVALLELDKGNDKLIKISLEKSKVEPGTINLVIKIGSKILHPIIEKLDQLPYIPMIEREVDGKEIDELTVDFKLQRHDQTKQVDIVLTGDYGRTQRTHSLIISKRGEELNNFDINMSLTFPDKKSIQGQVALKLIDNVKVKALLKDTQEKKHGFEFQHSSNMDKTEVRGTLYYQRRSDFEGSFDLLVTNIKHIELTLTVKSSIPGRELRTLKYKHEGQDNRISCSLSIDDRNGKIASIDLVAEKSPIHLITLMVKSPFKKIEHVAISGDYDHIKFNSQLTINGNKIISLSGVHKDLKNPKFTLETSLRQLQLLSVDIDGQMTERSARFTLQSNDNDKVDGKVTMKYDIPSQVTINGEIKIRIEQSENVLKFELESEEQPRRSHILIALNERNQIKYDSKEQSDNVDELKGKMNIELHYPSLDMKTNGVVLTLLGDKEKAVGKIQVLDKSGKAFDADINIDLKSDRQASLIVREPRHMEYRFTQSNFKETNENELYFNWNRDDPSSSLIITGQLKDESNSHKMEKSVRLRLSCPTRSIGIQHSITATMQNVESHGKIYWNDDIESQLSYELQLKDESSRRRDIFNGHLNLKLQLPTRTVGILGDIRDDDNERQATAILSWDKDVNKRIGMRVTVLKRPHMQAAVSVNLFKKAYIDSKVIVNKGNTIFEGETQLRFSEDSSKTVTLFSKMEKHPGHSGYFYSEDKQNYSVQLGMKHPESHIDVKMVSHLGVDAEHLTTSVGLDYLTSRKQMNNMMLFVEINKLKKEMNLFAVTPYKNVDISGAILRQDPLVVRVATTIDNDKMAAKLLVDSNDKKVNLDLTKNDKRLSCSASIPAPTQAQFEVKRHENDQVHQDIKASWDWNLVTETVHTKMDWRPGMLVNLRDNLFNTMKQGVDSIQENTKEIVQDLEKEVTHKYKKLASTIFDDAKKFVDSVEQEIASIEKDFEKMQHLLHRNIEFCDVQIGNIDLNEEIASLQTKVRSALRQLNEKVNQYTQDWRDVLRSVSNKLEELKNLPIEQLSRQVAQKLESTYMKDIIQFLRDLLYEDLEKIMKFITDLNEIGLNKQLQKLLKAKVSSEIAKMEERNIHIVSLLKTIPRKVQQSVSEHPLTQKIIEIMETHANEVYQIGKWTVQYMDVDDMFLQHLDKIVDFINREIREEMERRMNSMSMSSFEKMVKYDEKQGLLHTRINVPGRFIEYALPIENERKAKPVSSRPDSDETQQWENSVSQQEVATPRHSRGYGIVESDGILPHYRKVDQPRNTHDEVEEGRPTQRNSIDDMDFFSFDELDEPRRNQNEFEPRPNRRYNNDDIFPSPDELDEPRRNQNEFEPRPTRRYDNDEDIFASPDELDQPRRNQNEVEPRPNRRYNNDEDIFASPDELDQPRRNQNEVEPRPSRRYNNDEDIFDGMDMDYNGWNDWNNWP